MLGYPLFEQFSVNQSFDLEYPPGSRASLFSNCLGSGTHQYYSQIVFCQITKDFYRKPRVQGSVNSVALEFPFTDENLNDRFFYMKY